MHIKQHRKQNCSDVFVTLISLFRLPYLSLNSLVVIFPNSFCTNRYLYSSADTTEMQRNVRCFRRDWATSSTAVFGFTLSDAITLLVKHGKCTFLALMCISVRNELPAVVIEAKIIGDTLADL